MDDVPLGVVVGLARDDLARAVEEVEVGVAHELHLYEREVAGDDGRDHPRLEHRQVRAFVLRLRDQLLDQRGERAREREEYDAAQHGEDRVRHRDRGHDAEQHRSLRRFGHRIPAREERLAERHEDRQDQRKEQQGSYHVGERVRERGALRRRGRAYGGQPGGHRRADVRAEQHGDGRLVPDELLGGEGHRHRDRRGGALDHGCEGGCGERGEHHAAERARVEAHEHLSDGVVVPYRQNPLGHEVHPEEDEPQPEDREAEVVEPLVPDEEVERSAEPDADEPEHLRVGREGHYPHRGRRADVRADYHVERLLQRHEAGRHEAHQHDGDDRGGLHKHCGDDAGADAGGAVRRRQ